MAETTPFNFINVAQLKITKSVNHRVIYANNIRLGVSPSDIQMALGNLETLTTPIGSPPAVEDQATLVIALPQAKSLVQMLLSAINSYELKFGKVNFPDEYSIPEIVPAGSVAQDKK